MMMVEWIKRQTISSGIDFTNSAFFAGHHIRPFHEREITRKKLLLQVNSYVLLFEHVKNNLGRTSGMGDEDKGGTRIKGMDAT